MAKTFKTLRDPRLGLDDQIPGRHFGYTINEIIKDRPEYIDWLMKNTQIQFHDSVYNLMDEVYPKVNLPKFIKNTSWQTVWLDDPVFLEGFDDVPF